MLKSIIILLVILSFVSCENIFHDTDDTLAYQVYIEELQNNYPNVPKNFLVMYGEPNYMYDSNFQDLGADAGNYTKVVWDGTNNDYRSITAGDVITATFVDGELSNWDYAEIDTEADLMAPILATITSYGHGTLSSTEYLYDGTYYYEDLNDDKLYYGDEFYIDDNFNNIYDDGETFSDTITVDGVWTAGSGPEFYTTENNFRGVDNINGTIDYLFYDPISFMTAIVSIKKLCTLSNGDDMYGLISAIIIDTVTFDTINISSN